MKVFPVLLAEQKPHHVFCHRLCSPLETLVVREGKSLSMVPVGVEGVGGLAGGGGRGERGEGRSLWFPPWPRQGTHPGQTLPSSEQQSLSFYAPDRFGAMGDEIIRHRKEHLVRELCVSGKPEEWPQLPLCSLRPAST